ncbi:hypothetical protein JCM10213_006294 [Rhodosporidiobolus nylandii]
MAFTDSTAPYTTTLALPDHATRDLLLLVLLADTPIPAVCAQHGTYHDIFSSLFQSAIAAAEEEGAPPADAGMGERKQGTAEGRRYTLTVESWDAVGMSLPSEERVKEADGVLITGSASNAYDPLPWIDNLVRFVSRLPSLNPSLHLIGICFGHQIVARAFGGVCEPNEKGWEIGTRKLELTEKGREVFPGKERLGVHQMHRDHVPACPPSFDLLASSRACDVHGFVRFFDSSAPFSLQNIAVVTLQGHPEFKSSIVNELIDAREKKGVISHEVAEESREAAGEKDDGVYIGRRFLGMFGV